MRMDFNRTSFLTWKTAYGKVIDSPYSLLGLLPLLKKITQKSTIFKPTN